MLILFLLKTVVLMAALVILLAYTATQMKIKFPPGAILALGVILPILIAIPYAGWFLAALFLLRFTTIMTNADFWPESSALTIVTIPLLYLMKIILF